MTVCQPEATGEACVLSTQNAALQLQMPAVSTHNPFQLLLGPQVVESGIVLLGLCFTSSVGHLLHRTVADVLTSYMAPASGQAASHPSNPDDAPL